MAWTPTKAILTPRAIPDNLLTYVTDDDRQTDALAWAGDARLKAVKTVHDIRLNKLPPYPSIEFSDDNDEQLYGDDMIPGVYSCTFDIGVQGTDVDTVRENARKYVKAIVSMIINCPSETLGADTGCISGTAQIENVQTGFLKIQAGNKGKATNDFLQAVQIKVTVSLYGRSAS